MGRPARMCLRITLPIPRAGQSSSCAADTVTMLSAMSTASTPGMAKSSSARGDCGAAPVPEKCADSFGKSGRSTVKEHRSPVREGSPVILISESMTEAV